MAVLLEREILELVEAKTKDPYGMLGMHKLNDKQLVIRTIQPAAEKIEFVSEKLNGAIAMEKIHSDGLFELVIDSEEFLDYKFKFYGHHGGEWESKDSYSFLPVLTEYDLYLFKEGNHHRVYEKLGAHIIENEGVEGTLFSVWAPEAARVSVVGTFNSWDGRVSQMRMLGSSGVWEIFIPSLGEGELYRFEVLSKHGAVLLKSDPYAFKTELRPANASVVCKLEDSYEWSDGEWMKKRKETDWLSSPMSCYEVHLGSWARDPMNPDRFLSYRELAEKLVDYVKKMNYTHVELMPVAEHPLDESWGYQVTGYFSTTTRFGSPQDFMHLVDTFHKNGIGVILDWVPGHFPKDSHGLGRFDGTAVYEHADPRQGEHMDWGTYIFNYGRNEVKNFLITNALFWLDKFHIDGFRVDAVASMIYLDYSREAGEWVPNKYGGRENLEAIEFMQYMNAITHEYYPGILTIAEESTAFPGVSKPTYLGGLGFSMKWNMGWMNDSLDYIEKNPIYRRYHHNNLTFSMVYSFSENFTLVLSHDEVVHGKKSMLEKMPGDYWQKFANLRLFYAYMLCHPGKKLNFMGAEFGQLREWNCKQSLDWHLLEHDSHKKMQNYVSTVNKVYKENPAFWEIDFDFSGFEWLDFHDTDNSVISFMRKGKEENEILVCVFNYTPIPRHAYRVGAPKAGYYEEILNSDSLDFWGTNIGNFGGLYSDEIAWQGRENSLRVDIPPLGAVVFKYKG